MVVMIVVEMVIMVVDGRGFFGSDDCGKSGNGGVQGGGSND